MMNDQELKNRLNSIIDDCEKLTQWIGEVYAAMGEDMYQPLYRLLDRLYEEAVGMSNTAMHTRLAIARHSGKFDNEKTKEDEE